MKKNFLSRALLFVSIIFLFGNVGVLDASAQIQSSPQHVIVISVDGLRSDAITQLGEDLAPNFHYLMHNGAYTLNARNDNEKTLTMPNHTSIITGRPAAGEKGHHFISNVFASETIHDIRGEYVFSMFDVAHNKEYRTAFFASKEKFKIFTNSYGGHQRPYSVSIRSKVIDHYEITADEHKLLKLFISELQENKPVLSFFHFKNPDVTGHEYGWITNRGSEYMKAVEQIDNYLGKIIKTIEKDPVLSGNTTIILTSDHGGFLRDHSDNDHPYNYIIPFIVWSPSADKNKDLYELNKDIRVEPGYKKVPVADVIQPVRNADAGNLAVSILGLPPIPGSYFNYDQKLQIRSR